MKKLVIVRRHTAAKLEDHFYFTKVKFFFYFMCATN